jgi:hypothetical protein
MAIEEKIDGSPEILFDQASGSTVAYWCMRCKGWVSDAAWLEHVKTHPPKTSPERNA